MNSFTNNKPVVIALVICVLAFFSYKFFFQSDPLSETGNGEAIGADLLQISDDLSKATLSRELFSNSGYRLLSDFSVSIPVQPVGRANPFDIIGR